MRFRVLQILGDSKFGGGTYLVLSWCRFLVGKGCDVALLSTDNTTISKAKQIEGVRIIHGILIPRDPSPLQDIKAVIALLRLLRKESFDVVHTHTSTPGFVGRMAAWLAGTRLRFHSAHGWPVSEFSKLGARLIFTLAEYLAGLISTRIICVSHATATLGRRLHIAPVRKLVTICNGIDPEPFIVATENNSGKEVREELGIPSDWLVIGNVNRLALQKDNNSLIKAIVPLKRLLRDRPFVLLLVGDGPDRKKLENLATSLGVNEQVRFLGFRQDIPRILSVLDIFVSPSLWEGLSISLLEAMAAAKPIVTTSILPNVELIQHEVTGLLVPPKSPEQIAKAIVRFVEEPDLAQRCGIAARQHVLEHYTIDRMFQEMWDLYISLLHEKCPERIEG
jgi:glycosyltransferase involved in cell wall biosynthesis